MGLVDGRWRVMGGEAGGILGVRVPSCGLVPFSECHSFVSRRKIQAAVDQPDKLGVGVGEVVSIGDLRACLRGRVV